MMKTDLDRITTTIKGRWLAEIVAGTKKVEYRQIKPYWTSRLKAVTCPFELRLRNGMNPPVPEATVLIHKVTRNGRKGNYELHIKRVLVYKHCRKLVSAL